MRTNPPTFLAERRQQGILPVGQHKRQGGQDGGVQNPQDGEDEGPVDGAVPRREAAHLGYDTAADVNHRPCRIKPSLSRHSPSRRTGLSSPDSPMNRGTADRLMPSRTLKAETGANNPSPKS